MKIVNFETIKEKVNKLDTLAQADTNPITVFQKGPEKPSVAERMNKFFEIADGENSGWSV